MKTHPIFHSWYLKKRLVLCILYFLLATALAIESLAQENETNEKEIRIKNESSEKLVKIKVNDRIRIVLKYKDKELEGTVLSISDSTLFIGFRQPPYKLYVLINNIKSIRVLKVSQKKGNFIAKIRLIDGSVVKGALAGLLDKEIEIVSRKAQTTIRIPINTIDVIFLRRKNSFAAGLAIGAVAGGTLGGLIGIVSYHEPEPTANPFAIDLGPGVAAAAGATLGLSIGLVIGGIAGSDWQGFHIKGDPINYKTMKESTKVSYVPSK